METKAQEAFKQLQDKYSPAEILISMISGTALELDGIEYAIKCFGDELVAIPLV